MVSQRCKLSVKDTLEKLGIAHGLIELGKVELLSEISAAQLKQLKLNLSNSGFEILEDHKNILIEKIKTIIVEMVHYEDDLPKTNFSQYITGKLPYDYTYLANIFSEVKGTTIERFIIMHKIERIKELLGYDELSLTEISYKLNYSSVAHLSMQFKKITGLTPTDFKRLKNNTRNELEDL
jgi:YesN/AraC family two-component response regulator